MFYEEIKKTENSDLMWEYWQEYRNKLTNLIISNIESFNIKKELIKNKAIRLDNSCSKEMFLSGTKKPTLAIWGAGGCNDIDIERLSDFFQLVLIDCDAASVNSAIEKYNVNEVCRYIDLKFWDISDDEYNLFEAMLIDGVEIETIREYLLELSDKMAYYSHEAFQGFDYSVVVGLTSQLNARFMALMEIYSDEERLKGKNIKRIYSRKDKEEIKCVIDDINKKAVKKTFDLVNSITNNLVLYGYEIDWSDKMHCERLSDKCKNINDECEENNNRLPVWAEKNLTCIMGARELETEIIEALKKQKRRLFDCKGLIWNFTPKKEYLMLIVALERIEG